MVNYNFTHNVHKSDSPRYALSYVFGEQIPNSVLDVGCGPGYWMRHAAEMGVASGCGIDAHRPDEASLSSGTYQQVDLTSKWDLGRKFDLAFCLEVAEHLDSVYARTFVESLCRHSETVVFSAACPGQSGQHHVNCQWPSYWQEIFNSNGYLCDDAIRWRMWDDERIEPWYRQNLFLATKSNSAGKEERLRSVVHPGIAEYMRNIPGMEYYEQHVKEIAGGSLPFPWYVKATWTSAIKRVGRVFGLDGRGANASSGLNK